MDKDLEQRIIKILEKETLTIEQIREQLEDVTYEGVRYVLTRLKCYGIVNRKRDPTRKQRWLWYLNEWAELAYFLAYRGFGLLRLLIPLESGSVEMRALTPEQRFKFHLDLLKAWYPVWEELCDTVTDNGFTLSALALDEETRAIKPFIWPEPKPKRIFKRDRGSTKLHVGRELINGRMTKEVAYLELLKGGFNDDEIQKIFDEVDEAIREFFPELLK
jgi:hypothetical protein